MADTTEQTPPVQDETVAAVEDQQAASAAAETATEAPPAEAAATDDVANGEEEQEQPEEDVLSKKVTLADLCAKGAALYAHKQYDEAAEIYAQAAEQQADINGELNPENSEILFLYGRSLFKVGQSKSDVLGGKAAAGDKKAANGTKKAAKKSGAAAAASSSSAAAAAPAETEAQRVAEEGVAIVAAEKDGAKKEDETLEAKKPLFQFTGDENWDDSDEEEAEGEAEDEDEEDDDLAVAFEVLDLARVLFEKRLDEVSATEADGKGKEVSEGDSLQIKHVKERLADTHDLLAEISLENERYPNAIVDSRASLKYKQELYPIESEIIAEAHFKLSLALEFASVTQSEEEEGAAGGAAKQEQKPVDEKLREEAAQELEAAINSTKLKLQNKEVELATMASPEDNDVTRTVIAEVKDMISDMEARLVELRKPPIDVNAALAAGNPMSGILGATLGESAAETEARVAEAKKTATDLTGLVRKKNKDSPAAAPPAAETNGSATNGKRKAEEPAPAEEDSKKVKVADATEA